MKISEIKPGKVEFQGWIENLRDKKNMQFIVIRDLYTLICRINKQGFIINLIFFHYHDAGCNGGSKEKVAW